MSSDTRHFVMVAGLCLLVLWGINSTGDAVKTADFAEAAECALSTLTMIGLLLITVNRR